MVDKMPADSVTIAGLDYPAIIGKLPGHGDFIARGVAHGVRRQFDTWISGWMALAREELGQEFRSLYEAAPPWLWESAKCTAILLPSMDAVGRLYPLLIVSDPDRLTQDLYDCAIAAMANGRSADELRSEIDALSQAPRAPQHAGWFVPEGADRLMPAPDAAADWDAVEGWLG